MSFPARNVVLFDGVCVLCDRSMRFLLRIDRRARLSFAPLQGETARSVLERHSELSAELATVIYVRALDEAAETVYEKSDAALAILEDVGGFWRTVALARILPRWVRDGVYDWIARHRYGWFGKLDVCQLPDDESSERFLP